RVIGMMSVVVEPTSMSRQSANSRPTRWAVAAQFAEATASGSCRASAGVRHRASTPQTRTHAWGNAAVTASSTNPTPSRLVRNSCDSSAVIVTACASAGPASTSRARRSSIGGSAAGSRLVTAGAVGDPLAFARAYRDALGCDEWYVADLDAIAGGGVQQAVLRGLAGLGGRLLVDAAVTAPERARELVADGVQRVVVGL